MSNPKEAQTWLQQKWQRKRLKKTNSLLRQQEALAQLSLDKQQWAQEIEASPDTAKVRAATEKVVDKVDELEAHEEKA